MSKKIQPKDIIENMQTIDTSLEKTKECIKQQLEITTLTGDDPTSKTIEWLNIEQLCGYSKESLEFVKTIFLPGISTALKALKILDISEKLLSRSEELNKQQRETIDKLLFFITETVGQILINEKIDKSIRDRMYNDFSYIVMGKGDQTTLISEIENFKQIISIKGDAKANNATISSSISIL